MTSDAPPRAHRPAINLWRLANAVTFAVGLMLPSDGGQILGFWLMSLLPHLLALLAMLLGSPDIRASLSILLANAAMLAALGALGWFHYREVNRAAAPAEPPPGEGRAWPLVALLAVVVACAVWREGPKLAAGGARLLAYTLVVLSAASGLAARAVARRALGDTGNPRRS